MDFEAACSVYIRFRGVNGYSAGQLNGILTEKKDSFHDEKTEVLLAGLEVSSYVQVDDTGARHWAVENQATAGKGLPSDFVSPFDSLASETDAATA